MIDRDQSHKPLVLRQSTALGQWERKAAVRKGQNGKVCALIRIHRCVGRRSGKMRLDCQGRERKIRNVVFRGAA